MKTRSGKVITPSSPPPTVSWNVCDAIKQARWLHFYRENIGNIKGITAKEFLLGFSTLSFQIEHDPDNKHEFYERQILHLCFNNVIVNCCIEDQKSNWANIKHTCTIGSTNRLLEKALIVIGHPFEMDRLLDLNDYLVTKEDLIDLMNVLLTK